MGHAQLDRLLHLLAEREGGTDLHLKVGSPPRIRVKGTLETVADEPLLDKATVDAMAGAVLTTGARETFLVQREAECTYSVHGLGRFRVSAYLQRGSIALLLRRVTASARSFEELGLPATLSFLAGAERGLVLVAGPASSGVTTTLAAMVDYLNHSRACHIVTVEDPVEILHKDDLASISQRQVGVDTNSVAQGIRSALRQDPDVVVIGRVDALDVAQAAMSATEAGCLVIAGVRAADACEAITTLVGFSAEGDQRHVRLGVAGALVGAVSMRLVPSRTGTGRVPAVEILRNVPRVQAAVMGEEMDQVRSEMARGAALGMQTLNQALASLLERQEIDERAALAATPDWLGFRIALEQRGFVLSEDD
ncbi:MAG TPA: ATPase, T2SS/T4P/T4SS family [Acidimicrobiales bacterium]|nr:ATPase, T2SS/T4P/T4SS family [Acidimicrobiales bacterium]